MIASQVDISKALKIGGWMSEKELTWLATVASGCKRIVEFGCFQGRSTRALADNTDGIIFAVDPWNGEYFTESGDPLEQVNTYVLPIFKRNLADHISVGRVIPIRNFSFNFKTDNPVDLVFIDGDHRYLSVLKDIEIASSILKPGGIIAGHDYDHPLWTGVKKAVHEKIENFNVEDTIWWSRKS